MMTTSGISLVLLFPALSFAFVGLNVRPARPTFLFKSSSEIDADIISTLLDPNVSAKFKILTCSSTSCAKKRKQCGMDDFATYGAFYNRIQDFAPDVQLEESPCLGSCKMAPCVAIEHDDYEGTVALEGMSGNEFTDRV